LILTQVGCNIKIRMQKPSYIAVIPAAGFSSRMERFKPLLMIGGQTITDRLIDVFWKNGVDVTLVVGWQKEQLLNGIKYRSVRSVENPDFAKGMFSSIQSGLRAVQPGRFQGIFIHPVDIPLIRPSSVTFLLEAAVRNPGRIIYPVCAGQRGHPTLLPACIIPAVLEWQHDGGLKAVLEEHRELDLEVKVPDDYIHADMDTSADYHALLERFQDYEVPSPGECLAINEICGVAEDRRRHCLSVSLIALTLGEALAGAGGKIDLNLVRAGAILHDLAKGQKDHAGTGARILKTMGFARTAAVVAAHSDLPDGIAGSSMEDKIVFLADKFVAGETPVSLNERYKRALGRFGADSTIQADILQRKETALKVNEEFETVLGYPLERIIKQSHA
jgi:molybdenum cofactor cytidylyltransferase